MKPRRQHLFTVEQSSETAGDALVTWTVVGTWYGTLEGLTGMVRSGLAADADYRMQGRFYPNFSVRNYRLGLSGTPRKFSPLSALDPDGFRKDFVILCREQVI